MVLFSFRLRPPTYFSFSRILQVVVGPRNSQVVVVAAVVVVVVLVVVVDVGLVVVWQFCSYVQLVTRNEIQYRVGDTKA